MKKKLVMIIDDDERLLDVLKNVLSEKDYDVTICTDPTGARHIFEIRDYDVIISDLNLNAHVSGLDLMIAFKNIKSIPVILMTGLLELLDAKEALQKGADGFLAKPFQKKELFDLLEDILRPKEPPIKEDVDLDHEFVKLCIDDFVSGKEIHFDIFIRLSKQKYLKVAHAGENIPIEQIRTYKSKELNYLYLRIADFQKYIGFNLHLTPHLIQSKTISAEQKINFLKHTAEIITTRLFSEGLREEDFENTKLFVEGSVRFMSEATQTEKLLTMLNSHSNHLYAHAVGVAFFSCAIARKMKWESAATLYKLTIGGLLHDIGLKEFPKELLAKHREDLTAEEVTELETHPKRGWEILSNFSGINSDVLQIVFQHHEDCMGLGYPLKLGRSRIHPLAKVVAVADEFCNLTIENPNYVRLSKQEAIRKMLVFKQKFDPPALATLMKLFSFAAPNDFQDDVRYQYK